MTNRNKLVAKGPNVFGDATPDVFVITDASGAVENATVVSAPFQLAGMTIAGPVVVNNGEFRKNGAGAWTSSGTTLNDSIEVRGVANAAFLGFTNVIFTAGTVSDTFNIQTRSNPASGIATIGPHANYNGTNNTGSGVPAGAYALRTDSPTPLVAMSIGHVMNCPLQRVTGQLLLKIPCDAEGGIAGVDLSGDCANATIDTRSLVVFTDTNNRTWKEYYHAIFVDIPAFVAKGGTDDTRTATIYVVIRPTDGAKLKRLRTYTFHPAANANDGTFTVGAGKTYASIKAALNAAQAAGKKAPYVELYGTGAFFELEDSTWGVAAAHGHAVLANAPGATVTIGVTNPPNYSNKTTWFRTLGYDAIEFRSVGAFGALTIDRRNLVGFTAQAKGNLYRGTLCTNSIGVRDTLYWNKDPVPQFLPGAASWFEYDKFEFGTNATFQLAEVGHETFGTWSDIHSHTRLCYNITDRDSSSEYFRSGTNNSGIPSMTIRYSGSGIGTAAKTGGNGGGSLVIDDGNHPGASLNISLGADDNRVDITAVAALIAARSGWTATVQDTQRNARYLRGFGFGDVNGFTATDAKAADMVLATFIDVHGDGTQTNGGEENYIYWNWRMYGPGNYLSSVVFWDGQSTEPPGDRDFSFINCCLLAEQSGTVGIGGPGSHHKVNRHWTTNLWVTLTDGTQETNTNLRNSIMAGIGGGVAAPGVHLTNILHTVPNGGTAPTGPTYVNVQSVGNAQLFDIRSLLVDPDNNNFTPTGVALTTLAVPDWPYDINGILRTPGGDCYGAKSKNAV